MYAMYTISMSYYNYVDTLNTHTHTHAYRGWRSISHRPPIGLRIHHVSFKGKGNDRNNHSYYVNIFIIIISLPRFSVFGFLFSPLPLSAFGAVFRFHFARLFISSIMCEICIRWQHTLRTWLKIFSLIAKFATPCTEGFVSFWLNRSRSFCVFQSSFERNSNWEHKINKIISSGMPHISVTISIW